MYLRESQILVPGGEGPELEPTNVFNSLLDTLPDDSPVPLPIVKLGLLTRHLRIVPDGFETDFDKTDIELSETAVVPPETLSAVEYFLYHYCDHLSEEEKKRVGRFCEATQLNRKTELGNSESAVRKSVANHYTEDYPFISQSSHRCEYCGENFDSLSVRDEHLSSCDQNPEAGESDEDRTSQKHSSKKRPALGKEIKKNRGSERVAGRNRFADPERLKDTGLHQGGGN